jgi:hypothetical protein
MYLEPGQNMEARVCVCVCDTKHTKFDIQGTMHHDIFS